MDKNFTITPMLPSELTAGGFAYGITTTEGVVCLDSTFAPRMTATFDGILGWILPSDGLGLDPAGVAANPCQPSGRVRTQ
jgi:hypothetical protein